MVCPVLITLPSNDKTKGPYTPWKLGSNKNSKYWFCLSVDIFDWYSFQIIVLLKPYFNRSSSFALSWFNEAPTVIVIAIIPAPAEFVMTQIDDHLRIRLISQLITGISIGLQKLLNYFNGTGTLISVVLSATFVSFC